LSPPPLSLVRGSVGDIGSWGDYPFASNRPESAASPCPRDRATPFPSSWKNSSRSQYRPKPQAPPLPPLLFCTIILTGDFPVGSGLQVTERGAERNKGTKRGLVTAWGWGSETYGLLRYRGWPYSPRLGRLGHGRLPRGVTVHLCIRDLGIAR
jgi:hypothetical protein